MSDKDDKNDNVTAFPNKKQRAKRDQKHVRTLEVGNTNIKQTGDEPIFNLPPTTKLLIMIMLGVNIAIFLGTKLIPDYD